MSEQFLAPPPKHKSTLVIAPRFLVHLPTPMPNRWHRFWYRVLLGWTWRSATPVRIEKLPDHDTR